MEDRDVLTCEPWNYLEIKNEKYLLVWPDLPKWMVIDKELFLLLKELDGKKTLNEVTENLAKSFNKDPSEIKIQISQILPLLIKTNIVFEKNCEREKIEKEEKKIEEIAIHITNRCNLQCKMCCNKFNVGSFEDEIKSEEIKKFLNDILEFTSKTASLSITGGEALLVKDKTLDIVEYAKKIGIERVSVVTNGILIDEDFAKKAKKLDLNVQVSLDSAFENEHDFLRGEGAYKKTIEGIKKLKKEGVFVIVSMVVHKDNLRRLGAYYDLAIKLGVDSARFITLKRIGGGLDDSLELVPIDELLKFAYDMFKRHPEYNKIKGSDFFSAFSNTCRLAVKHGYCGTGLIAVLLNHDGSIYPCSGHALPIFKAGNIRDKSFSDIWLNSPVLKELRKTYDIDNLNEKCSKCLVRNWCLGGCRAEAYHMTHKLNSPDFQCENIKKAILEMFWLLSEETALGKGDVYRAD